MDPSLQSPQRKASPSQAYQDFVEGCVRPLATRLTTDPFSLLSALERGFDRSDPPEGFSDEERTSFTKIADRLLETRGIANLILNEAFWGSSEKYTYGGDLPNPAAESDRLERYSGRFRERYGELITALREFAPPDLKDEF